MSERTYFRESQVSITLATRWALTRIVKAQSKAADELAVPETVDALAEKILSGWLEQNFPELLILWENREQLDSQAEARVNERKR